MKRLNEILNIEFPIIQGGMANIATGSFAAAVSNAGGMGVIATGGLDADGFKEHIRLARSKTDRPFGVNILMIHPQVDELAQVAASERVPFITTGAGNPERYIDAWKQAGAQVFPVVPSVALAKRMQRLGADGVIAEGTESGGHIGELTTMALVPQVAGAVDIPVVAAGGIACGRQLLAAFALGSCGVQVGTCLLVSEECPIHENYKNALIKASDTATTVTGRIAGVPVRIIKNNMAREYVKREKEGATRDELETYTLGSLRRAVYDGDVVTGSVMAGQVCGSLTQIRPIRQIFEEMIAEYNALLPQLTKID